MFLSNWIFHSSILSVVIQKKESKITLLLNCSQHKIITSHVVMGNKEGSLWFKFQKAGQQSGTGWSLPVFHTLIANTGFFLGFLFTSWTLFVLTLRESWQAKSWRRSKLWHFSKLECTLIMWSEEDRAVKNKSCWRKQKVNSRAELLQLNSDQRNQWCFICGLLQLNHTCMKWLAERRWNE